MNVLLISTYELGRQPFGLASPAAWLAKAGMTVRCLDLSIEPLDAAAVQQSTLIGFYVPMHMGTRMAVPVIEQVQQLNPQAHLCCFGLYAPVSESYLRKLGVDTILGGEFETGLRRLAQRLGGSNGQPNNKSTNQPDNHLTEQPADQPAPIIFLERQDFLKPDRSSLPPLQQYAQLVTAPGQAVTVGYTEASRGCKHVCRHCPIVPVYNGRFRIVQQEVVLADIRQQVAGGAQHITFGDPDFFNGPGHAIPLVKALHAAFPELTYDVTIKVEHLRQQADRLATLKETGCLFITTAVESFDPHILEIFDKRHTHAEFEQVVAHCRALELHLVPTFVPFTPWTTLEGYRHFLQTLVRLDLVDQVSPIQCAIRLLIPPGSRLLELQETRTAIGPMDEARLSYTWRNPDPRVDALQADLELMVQSCAAQNVPRRQAFERIWQRTFAGAGDAAMPALSPNPRFVPYLTEPWYC